MTLEIAIIAFVASALIIALAGTQLAKTADQLADVTGIGEALVGAVLLGGITSLSGLIVSVSSAYQGHPDLAISNALGGIAAQIFFLAIADVTYRKANLEHASASFSNVMQAVFLMALLAFLLVVFTLPEVTWFHIHPASLLLLLAYFLGIRMISRAGKNPMWSSKTTEETVRDVPNQNTMDTQSVPKVVTRFLLLAAIVAVSGYTIAQSGIVIADSTTLSETFVGSLFTAVSTSLPELIVSLSAVRNNALVLAVSNIIGGNTFDVITIAFIDIAYLDGSLLHAVQLPIFLISLTLLMTAVITLGLLHREKYGFAKIGWESVLIIILFLSGYTYLFFQ